MFSELTRTILDLHIQDAYKVKTRYWQAMPHRLRVIAWLPAVDLPRPPFLRLHGPGCLVIFGFGQPQRPWALLLGSLQLRPTPRPIRPSWTEAIRLANPTALVAALLVSLRPLRSQLLGRLRLRPTPRSLWPLLASLWLLRSQLLCSLGFSQPHSPCDLAVCEHSAYTAPAAFGFDRPHGPC